MGREVRMVPPNWDHPIVTRGNGREGKQRMHDQTYKSARDEWVAGLMKWERGEDRPGYMEATDDYWDYAGPPPERNDYRPWADDEATWFQLWETVSEGTPVSPPFATKEELAQYLADNGDEWDQKRCWNHADCQIMGLTYGKPGWGIERARAFVNAGWAPSMMVANGVIHDSKDIPLALQE